MSTKEDRTTPVVDSGGEGPARLGPDKPVRTFQDILNLSLAMIEAQRTRVARAMAEETRTGSLDKGLSVEIKRLNAMLATYNELVNTPQAKAAKQPRARTGAVSQILRSIAPLGANFQHVARTRAVVHPADWQDGDPSNLRFAPETAKVRGKVPRLT